VIDLGQIKTVKQISLGTLQDTEAWIVFPKEVQYALSDDGKNYKHAITVNTKVNVDNMTPQIQTFTGLINGKARYIKVVAKQYGPLPQWHESKGNSSYIFADEIKVE
jgi:hypothetical protein